MSAPSLLLTSVTSRSTHLAVQIAECQQHILDFQRGIKDSAHAVGQTDCGLK